MDQIPPDKEDTKEVQDTFAKLSSRARRSNAFFESRRPLGTDSRTARVTQMTQEDDEIEEDDDSIKSQELAPIPYVSPIFVSVLRRRNQLPPVFHSSPPSSTSRGMPSIESTPTNKKDCNGWITKSNAKNNGSKKPAAAKTAVKVQVGALVKKRMRVKIDEKYQTAMVFGTVVKKIWSNRWRVKFENNREMRLSTKDFEVVANDSTQKQLKVNEKNEINLVTPVENHIYRFKNDKREGNNLKNDMEEEEQEDNNNK